MRKREDTSCAPKGTCLYCKDNEYVGNLFQANSVALSRMCRNRVDSEVTLHSTVHIGILVEMYRVEGEESQEYDMVLFLTDQMIA